MTSNPETPGNAGERSSNTAAPDPAVPDLLPGEAEEDLRATVRDLLATRAPWNATLARSESDEPYDPALWRLLARDVGCAGLAIPEKLGGAGASWREVAVVAEELGRAAAPTPFLGSSAIATAAFLALRRVLLGAACEAETDVLDAIRALAEGQTTAALVVPFSTVPNAPIPESVRADASGRLTGAVTSVADIRTADVFLVPALAPDGEPALYLTDAVRAGERLKLSPVTSLDLTRPLSDVSLDAAPARLLASGSDAQYALRFALTVGAIVLAAEQLGIAEACLDMTVGYLKTRRQFGRLIGSYQALKHRVADLWSAVAQARAVARYAAACIATGSRDTPQAAAIAQAYCSGVAVRAAEECVQLHGGIGFTWEHPAHLYLKRAKADAIALGTAEKHRRTLGDLVGLPVE
ncbi:MAG TPA: acyl-CoA dehydrogenase family protein [Actinocrinis sp.]|nr:acyl-CoA dehydrogenase family protein [Actinocrinis sp.]HEV3174096.1 acyl-CoA dehydrogenase family protein [Actinocrinis sp.]